MFVRISTILGIHLFLAGTIASAQHDKLSVDKHHMVGVVEAHFANLESWRSGDFLIRISEIAPGSLTKTEVNPDGERQNRVVEGPEAISVIREMSRIYRVRFDFDQERLFVASRTRRQDQMFDSLDREIGRPILFSDDLAGIMNKPQGVLSFRSKAGLIERLQAEEVVPPMESALEQFGVPNIKFIGLAKPLIWTGGHLDRKLDEMRKQDDMVEITQVGVDRYQMSLRHDIDPQDRRRGQRVLRDWDVKRNVPVAHTLFIGYAPGDHPLGNKPFRMGSAEWSLVNEVQVPISARYSGVASLRVDDRMFQLNEEVTVDIHWFSINTDLPEELFDEEVLHDRKKLDGLLDISVLDEKKRNASNSNEK